MVNYAQFVKEHIHKFSHLPAKERMKAVAQLYHQQKGSASAPAKKGRGRPKKGGLLTAAGLDNKGGSFLGDIFPPAKLLGLGLDEKGGSLQRKKGRPSKKGGAMTAGSFLGDIVPFGHMLGLGLDEKGGAMTAGSMHRKRGRPSKRGGAMTAGAFHGTSPTMTGGGWFDSFKQGFLLPFEAIGHVAPALAHLV